MKQITNEQIKKYASYFDPKRDDWDTFVEWTLYDLILADMGEVTANNEHLYNSLLQSITERVWLCHFNEGKPIHHLIISEEK